MDKAPPPLLAAAPLAAPLSQDAVLRCQGALLARRGLAESATALCVEMAELLQCRRVSIGLLERERLRITGSSQANTIDARHEAAVALSAAMHEALDQSQGVAWPPVLANAPVSLANRELAGQGQACSIPIVVAGKAIGAVTL